MDGILAGHVLADRAYDSDALVRRIVEMGANPVIPSKSNRKSPRQLEKELYKNRNRVERLFNRLKQFRRIATRYDKLARRYAAFILVSAAVVWGTW